MKNKVKYYIIMHNIGKDIKWYVADIKYDESLYPESDWVFRTTDSQEKHRALKLVNKDKAQLVANVLSNQVDEYGCSFEYYVKEIK